VEPTTSREMEGGWPPQSTWFQTASEARTTRSNSGKLTCFEAPSWRATPTQERGQNSGNPWSVHPGFMGISLHDSCAGSQVVVRQKAEARSGTRDRAREARRAAVKARGRTPGG
jgi:hypothetical protein